MKRLVQITSLSHSNWGGNEIFKHFILPRVFGLIADHLSRETLLLVSFLTLNLLSLFAPYVFPIAKGFWGFH